MEIIQITSADDKIGRLAKYVCMYYTDKEADGVLCAPCGNGIHDWTLWCMLRNDKDSVLYVSKCTIQ